MKNKIINNDILIITSLFVIYNLLFRSLIMNDFWYHIMMIILVMPNVIFLIKYQEKVKYKSLSIII